MKSQKNIRLMYVILLKQIRIFNFQNLGISETILLPFLFLLEPLEADRYFTLHLTFYAAVV
jgi:hypothetical protein